MNYLSLINHQVKLFENDIPQNYDALGEVISKGRFLVIGGAGSIGQAFTREILSVIRNQPDFNESKLAEFMDGIDALRAKATWTKDAIVKLYFGLLLEFAHKETGEYLDQRM